MLRLLSRFDQFSFWIGFAAASLFWWLMARIMPAAREAWANYRERQAARRESQRTGVELDYRNEFIRFIQGNHLAAPLFSLDEIVIPPSVMAPPPATQPGADILPSDSLDRILPYTPDFPSFAAAFGAERLTLIESLSRGANLALLGDPGSGKTVALSHLGTLIASLSPDAGEFVEFVPFYIHAADLLMADLDRANHEEVFAETVLNAGYLSRRTSARLNRLIAEAFAQNRVFLLLDGLDELSPAGIEQVTAYLRVLIDSHPDLRVVAAASPAYYDGLTALGLAPVRIAGWSRAENKRFIRRWGMRWQKHISDHLWGESDGGMEFMILCNWLEQDRAVVTPLELTLKAWAAMAGDSLGPENTRGFDAYLRRTAGGIPHAETALERIAMQMAITMRPIAHGIAAGSWARGDLSDFSEEDIRREEKVGAAEAGAEKTEPGQVGRGVVTALIGAGVLVRRPGNYLSFAHPALAGYYAGRGLARHGGGDALAAQPPWSMSRSALHYLASSGDAGPVLRALKKDDPTHENLLVEGSWLRDMPRKVQAQTEVMRELASLFQNDSYAPILRQQALIALAVSRDPGVYALCNNLIKTQDPIARSMSALALGYSGDENHVPVLVECLSDGNFQVRAAACYALVYIGTQPAVETVATVLLHGDEDSQRAAAEALALNSTDGYELLMEASRMEDLLVRRAAIFGLAKTGRPEAFEVITAMQLEDEQWIVRNAADQAMQRIENGSPAIPSPYPSLHELDWLIHFAAQAGEGLAPGSAAEGYLLRALIHGDIEEKLAAMDRYSVFGTEEAVQPLVDILKTASSELQSAAILTIRQLRSQGFGQSKDIS